MTRDEVLARLETRTQAAQSELACRTDAGPKVLTYLAQNGAPATRRAVAANVAAPAQANRHLADDDDDDIRAELARKVARLMPSLSAAEGAHVHALTVETLERLARDQVPRVRAVLADAIKTLDCIPKFIVLTLARDLDAIVAAPILEYSPLLSDADLMEVIAAAKAEEVLAAIARRSTVSPAVSEALVSSLDIPAIAALLANPDAKIREKTLDDIAAQAETIQSWQVPLVLRADLSKRAILRIASFVGSSLIEQLAHALRPGRGYRTPAQQGIARPPGGGGAPGVLGDRSGGARRRGGARGRQARRGLRRAGGQCRPARRGRPGPGGARPRAGGDGAQDPCLALGKPLVALVWHAGLGMRLAFKIQSFVMKLPAGELLPARAGVHFPMTEDEMRWHLGYFDVAV
ncbi:MAG: DUF2336 domain-containing protein [Rhizomicrobium sp.]